jgi:hypothetical protein
LPATHRRAKIALWANPKGATTATSRRILTDKFDIDSPYAWRRLAVGVVLSTIGGIGSWCLIVSLTAIQGDLGVSRADVSLA